jgi:dihydrofolate reductase
LFDRITKYVATRNPNLSPTWRNSQTLGSDAVAAIKRLRSEEGPDLLTQGSSDFLQTLFQRSGRRNQYLDLSACARQG